MEEDAGPPAPSASRLSLPELLEEEDLSIKFRDFLNSIHGGENLAFWLEVELFHAMDGQEKNQDKIEARALDIFAKFIRPRGAQEINIDSERRMQLMLEMSNIKFNLFDEAQREIQTILETDSIPKFRREPAYQQWLEARATRKQEKGKDKAKKEKKEKARDPKDKHKHSLMGRLLGRDHDAATPPPPSLDQRGRSSTLESLRAWREAHHRKGGISSSPLGSYSSSPQRATSTSPPAAEPDVESPLALSAPNPTAAAKPALRASLSLTSVHAAAAPPPGAKEKEEKEEKEEKQEKQEKHKRKKERPKSGALASSVSVDGAKRAGRPKSGVPPSSLEQL